MNSIKQLERDVRALVTVILDDPEIPEEGVARSGLSGTTAQAFRNGYYSIRDTAEFKRLLELMKREEIW